MSTWHYKDIDRSDPWAEEGMFLFGSSVVHHVPAELMNLVEYHRFGRDRDDDVSLREFILRESPTARRGLKAFYERDEFPDRQPDELERRYLSLPDTGERSWFDQSLPNPRRGSPSERAALREVGRERWRRKDQERADARGMSLEQLDEERANRRRERARKQAQKERAEARKQGVPVKELREARHRQKEQERAEFQARDQRLWSEWEERKAAIRAERQTPHSR